VITEKDFFAGAVLVHSNNSEVWIYDVKDGEVTYWWSHWKGPIEIAKHPLDSFIREANDQGYKPTKYTQSPLWRLMNE
jgi:hypothetical protein